MKSAIVTGASSGIGEEISKLLLLKGYKVYGFGRDFSKSNVQNRNFIQEVCDLREINQLCRIVDDIKLKDKSIELLVNNAGIGYFGPHEELNPEKIHDMVCVNLEAPMILSNILLRNLKKNKGTIINISSVTANETSTYGCAYSATKSGITHFGESLFAEVRKTGVKIINVHPDITRSNFYRSSNFMEDSSDKCAYMEALDVAMVVKYIIEMNPNMVVTDISLKPQKHKIKRKKVHCRE